MNGPASPIRTPMEGGRGGRHLNPLQRFVLHGLVATVGGLVLGFVVLSFVPLHRVGPHWRLITFLTDVPYSPAFWLAALILGYVVNRYMGDRVACWVGVAGLLFMVLLILGSYPGYRHPGYELAASKHSFTNYIVGSLFALDPNRCPGDECLGKLFFTTPMLNSVAYSIGAAAALRRRKAVEA